MPVPSEYQRASQHFEAFMADVCAESGLSTTHQAWNMVVGVLHAFRRRLPLEDALGSPTCCRLWCGRSSCPTGTRTSPSGPSRTWNP